MQQEDVSNITEEAGGKEAGESEINTLTRSQVQQQHPCCFRLDCASTPAGNAAPAAKGNSTAVFQLDDERSLVELSATAAFRRYHVTQRLVGLTGRLERS